MQHFVATSNYLIFSSTDNHCFCMYLQTQKTIQNNSHFVGPEACTTSLSFLNNYLLLFEMAKRSTILALEIRRSRQHWTYFIIQEQRKTKMNN